VLISLEEWEARQSGDEIARSVGGSSAMAGPTSTSLRSPGIFGGDSARRPRDLSTLRPPVPPRRRNKITPDPDEPSDLEDDEDEFPPDDFEEDSDDFSAATSTRLSSPHSAAICEDDELEVETDAPDEDDADEDFDGDADWDEDEDDALDDEWEEVEDATDEEDDEVETDGLESGDDEIDEPEDRRPRQAISKVDRRQLAQRPGRK
jgi:hypothetical protein